MIFHHSRKSHSPKRMAFLLLIIYHYHCTLNRIILISALSLFFSATASAQARFSFATDLTVQHNFKKTQRYTTIGQTVHSIFNLTPKEGVYLWFTYYANGKFSNNLVATAKSPFTNPYQIPYVNQSKLRLKQLSIGYRKYFLGSCENEKSLNLYGYAGFGLEMGRVINTQSVSIDTSVYDLSVLPGKANFKRLTIDPGIGIERYLAGDLYVYGELRAWIPTTDYPSKYIFENENAPWVAMACVGIRMLF